MLTRPITGLLVLGIVMLSIGVTIYQVYPLYLAHFESKPNTSHSSTTTSQASPLKPQRPVASYALFGRLNALPTPVQQTENLPKTRLRLTLTGVSASTNPEAARALIEGPDRDTEAYAIGDTVPGNASLHEVYTDRVILNRGGKLETLNFPDSSSGTRLLSTVVEDQQETELQSNPYLPESTETHATIRELPKITSEQKQSIRDRLNTLRAKLRQQQ